MIVLAVPPVWATAIRSAIAAIAILILQIIFRQFIIPNLYDILGIFVISFFHMVVFGAFMAIGLQYISVGRSVVLGYVTPLWVFPGAWLFLNEPMRPLRIIGLCFGFLGIIILFNPLSINWSDNKIIIGHTLLLLASFSWAITILFIKFYTWRSSPFQLVFWQNLFAAALLAIIALFWEGVPNIQITNTLFWQFAYNGLLATAFGFWAMTMVNKHLSASVTSLGLLFTPIVGICSSLALLKEQPDFALLAAAALILAGIALGTFESHAK